MVVSLQLIDRQALHAKELKLKHPFLNENMHIIAPFPKDMEAIVNFMR